MEFASKQWDEINSLAALEFEHRTVLNRCGYPSCIETTGLHYCTQCQVRQYCCNEHRLADSVSHKRFCRPPIVDQMEPSVVRPAGYQPQPVQERKKVIESIVEVLYDSLVYDVYPPENLESVFGIQMAPQDSDLDDNEYKSYIGIDTPVGTVMYGCWAFLRQCNNLAYEHDIAATGHGDLDNMDIEEDSAYQFDASGVHAVNKQVAADAHETLVLEIVQAMLEGRLPAWFRFKLCEMDRMWLSVLGQPQRDAYFAEIMRRDFRGIRWNYQALATLAGK